MKVEVDKELEEIFPGYLESRRGDISKLNQAISNKDLSFLKMMGHRIAGNAPSYGLLGLGELAAQMEEAAKNGNMAPMEKLVKEMDAYLKDLEVVFI